MDAREAWFEAQLDLDPERIVFIDETAAATNMERRYGRAPRGERCRIAVPHGHYKTTTVTAALRAKRPVRDRAYGRRHDGRTLPGLCVRHARADASSPATRW